MNLSYSKTSFGCAATISHRHQNPAGIFFQIKHQRTSTSIQVCRPATAKIYISNVCIFTCSQHSLDKHLEHLHPAALKGLGSL